MIPLMEEIDVRAIAPHERHAQLFDRFDGLLPGEAGGSTEDDLLTPEEYAAHIQLVPEAMTDRIAARAIAPPLGPEFMAYMLRRWDEQIGAAFRQPG